MYSGYACALICDGKTNKMKQHFIAWPLPQAARPSKKKASIVFVSLIIIGPLIVLDNVQTDFCALAQKFGLHN